MKEEQYKKRDGSNGVKYTLEAGDKVEAMYDEPREFTNGKFPNFSLQVKTEDGKEVYISLTEGQAKKLKGKQLTGKTIEAYDYKNEYGNYVGVRVLEK